MSPSVYQTPEPNQMGGWSFLQTLTTPNKNNNNSNDDVVYVHPLAKKRSKSTLTEKGLEMCTESLGSETGSDVSPCDFPTPLPEPDRSFRARLRRVREEAVGSAGRGGLPPPIPSRSGVHVERVREGGRLVMKAVMVGPTRACFQAERVNGRLTLRFAETCAWRCEAYDGDGDGHGDHADAAVDDSGAGDMDGIFDQVEGENGANKFLRATTSRCIEEESRNRDLMVYPKAFCVATT